MQDATWLLKTKEERTIEPSAGNEGNAAFEQDVRYRLPRPSVVEEAAA